jgi:acyl-CoA thioesterase
VANDEKEPAAISFGLDRDAAVERVDERRWRCSLSERWSVGPIINGGFVKLIAARAMAAMLGRPDPLSVTTHFLAPAEPGPAEIEVEPLRIGRSFAFASARVLQAGAERARVTGVFGDLDDVSGPTRVDAPLPEIAPPASCTPVQPVAIEVARRFEKRIAPRLSGWVEPDPEGPAEFLGWVRFADGRDQDAFSLLLTADALPPPVFARTGPVPWVPTLELTVQVRARPAPGWLLCHTRTRFLTRGLMENDGELWDAGGNLVALARQLARFRT